NGNAFNTLAGTLGTGQLVRTDGLSWTADGLAVGQQVLLSIVGGVTGSYTIIGISSTGSNTLDDTLTLLAASGSPALANQSGKTGTLSVTDQLAVISGQVLGGQTTGNFDVVGAANLNRIVRDDGLPWASLGFVAGQQVAIAIGGNIVTR